MKYKIGDKVKIRTWKSMEKEYGLDLNKGITHPQRYCFSKIKEQCLNELAPNRILTIKRICKDYYVMTIIEDWNWQDWMIEYSIEEPNKSIPILTRFEILDL